MRNHRDTTEWEITREFRQWVTGFPLEKVDWLELNLDIRGVIEGVMRSFRHFLLDDGFQMIQYVPPGF